jgi:hypothetical protein
MVMVRDVEEGYVYVKKDFIGMRVERTIAGVLRVA